MIERGKRRDVVLEKRVDELGVEPNAFLIGSAVPRRQNSRPRNGEAVGIDTHPGQQLDVFAKPVVVVAGNVARIAILHLAGNVAEGIPDRMPLSTFKPSTLDLIARRRCAPRKTLGKCLHGLIGLMCTFRYQPAGSGSRKIERYTDQDS